MSHENELMRRTVDLASFAKSTSPRDPKVGVIVLLPDGTVSEAWRGQYREGEHAEYVALDKHLAMCDLSGSTVFTTLEPCTTRTHQKVACAQRLIEARISRVFIGMLDPNPDIYGRGLKVLEDKGIQVELYPASLRQQIKAINKEFIDLHKPGANILADRDLVGRVEVHQADARWNLAYSVWGKIPGSGPIPPYTERMARGRTSKIVQGAAKRLENSFPYFPSITEEQKGMPPFSDIIGLRAFSVTGQICLENTSMRTATVRLVGYSDSRTITGPLDTTFSVDIAVSFPQLNNGFIQIPPRDRSQPIDVTVGVHLNVPSGYEPKMEGRIPYEAIGECSLMQALFTSSLVAPYDLHLVNEWTIPREFRILPMIVSRQLEPALVPHLESVLQDWREVFGASA